MKTMNKTGLVMKIEKNNAFIMTSSGEFFKVKILSKSPEIGEEYTGKLKKERGFIKILITAACLLFMALSGGGVYDYYTPTSSVVININPSIKLEANRWVKIIKCSALNNDGETVLKSISIKNKSLNQGLNLIIQQSEKDDFINEKYIKDAKVISVKLSTKNNKNVDLSKFEEYVVKSNLMVEFNNNGIKTYFNRKIDKENPTGKDVNSKNIIKATPSPNKIYQDSQIRMSKSKNTEVKSIQKNYSRTKDNRMNEKDIKQNESQNELKKHKYEENNNHEKEIKRK